MKHRLELGTVIELLRARREEMIVELRLQHGDPSALEAKRQLDHAISCLELCQEHQIHPDSEVIALPWPRENFGSFEVFDVGETESSGAGLPLAVKGEPVTLGPGDLLIRVTHSFTLPDDV